MKIELGGRGTTLAVFALTVAACGGEGAADLGTGGSGGSTAPSATAGRGGTSGSSGAAGLGGAAGASEELPDAGVPPRFRAFLEGGRVRLTALDPAWVRSCDDYPALIQKLGDTWTLLRDERPPLYNGLHAAHYLDGVLDPVCAPSLGCDVDYCKGLDPGLESEDDLGFFSAVPREYVQAGERGAPTCGELDAGSEPDAGSDAGSDAGGRLVPNIESRAATGPLGVRVRYYRDRECDTGFVFVDVPVE